MEKLNVFISSTFFDLKQQRKTLKDAINLMGHEEIAHESYSIFYNPNVHTHVACVQAVEKRADILVVVIGSRFGGEAVSEVYNEIDFEELKNKSTLTDYFTDGNKFSVTQCEVLKALQLGIPVLTFVDKEVYGAKRYYDLNKNKGKDVKEYTYFSTEKENKYAIYIFEFIDFIRHLFTNNSVIPFEYIENITDYVKEYLSSYTKDLLLQNRRKPKKNEVEILPVEFPCEEVVDYITSISKVKKADFIIDSLLEIDEKGRGVYTITMKIKPADEHSHYAYEIFSDKPGKISIEECKVKEFPAETVNIGIKKPSHLRMNLLFKSPVTDEYTLLLKLNVENFMSDLIEHGEGVLERMSSNGNKSFKKITERVEFPDIALFKDITAKITKHPEKTMQRKITPKREKGKIIFNAVFNKKDKSTFNTDVKIEFFLSKRKVS